MELRPDPARKLSENLYDMYHCSVYIEKLLMMDRGTVRNMQFYSKYKFEKLVHLVGFIIRIYHDTRSPKRQMPLAVKIIDIMVQICLTSYQTTVNVMLAANKNCG